MRIERLVLKNFRGIREMDLELNRNLTVLVGVNGAGKSSILDAVALPLSDVFQEPPYWRRNRSSRAREPSGVKNSDVLNGQSFATIQIFLQSSRKSDRPDFDLEISRDESRGIDGTATTRLKKSTFVEQMEENLRRDQQSLGSLLAIRYIPERRISGKHAAPVGRDFVAPKFGYESALLVGQGIRQFFDWVQKAQSAESQKLEVSWKDALEMLKNGERPPGADPHLFAARKAIADFMHGKGLYFSVEDKAFFVHKNGLAMSINQLSDGEKSLLALVGDVTHRLSLTHPHLAESDRLLNEAEAVVMIDEIELHLHPQWQRMVVPRLVETFPNVQFIITTHSPQVLGEVHSENIVLLEKMAEGIRYGRFSKEVYGMTSNHILEAVMETPERSTRVGSPVREAYAALERGDVARAKELLAKLSEEARDIADVERIAMRIRRKEAVGK
jgi:predicted ATP-binding protein involved in virulence